MTGEVVPIDPNRKYIQELAAWAVQEYNKGHGTSLRYMKTVYAKEQVVAGMMYYIGLEAANRGLVFNYEVKVWVKAWIRWKKLEDFKPLLQDNAPIAVSN